jgi:hypothetical protein
MPDLALPMMRQSVCALGPSGCACADCGRTPLAGERLHELDSGRVLCELCFAALPAERRSAVSTQRVGASERKLAVAPMAA